MRPEHELIHGIEEQTQRRIDELRDELTRLEEDRKARVESEIEAIRKKTEAYAEAQIERARKAAAAAVATERHRIDLASRERFFRQVLKATTQRLRERIGNNGYLKVLRGWIVEASVGLAENEALVSTSEAEHGLCAQVLEEAQEEASRVLGTTVHLELSEAPLKIGQGVLLTARSGRTAYNNQVQTRMMRRETAVRRIIYEELSRASLQQPPENGQPGGSGEDDG